jgi:DNA-binding GntR family transcriptional regulator
VVDPVFGTRTALIAARLRVHLPSKAELTADALRAEILQGRVPPGTALREATVSEDLQISRNTLREAFQLLIHERLLVHEVDRGVSVRVLSPADVADIYTVRLALEGAGVCAAPHAPAARLADVASAVTEGEKLAAMGDWAGVGTADLEFHRALAGLLDSARVDEYIARLLAELRLAFHIMPSPYEFHEPYLHRNRHLADLITAGDLVGARRELAGYLADAQRQILARMGEVGQGGP